MPKAKPDILQALRLELQESERQSLDLVAGSMAVRNVGQGIGAILSPICNLSAAGAVALGSLGAAWAVGRADSIDDQLRRDPTGESVSTLGILANFVQSFSPAGWVTGSWEEGIGVQTARENADEKSMYFRALANKFENFVNDNKPQSPRSPL